MAVMSFGDFCVCGRSCDMSIRSSTSTKVLYLLLVGTSCFSAFLSVPQKYPLLDASVFTCSRFTWVWLPK